MQFSKSSSRNTKSRDIRKDKNKEKYKEVVEVVKKMKKLGIKMLRREWKIDGETVLRKRKFYVLKDETLSLEVIQLHYDIPVTMHRGKRKITELVTRNYWQLGVISNVRRYIVINYAKSRKTDDKQGSREAIDTFNS